MNRAARVASAGTSGRLLCTSATWGQALLLERQHRLTQTLQHNYQEQARRAYQPQQQQGQHQASAFPGVASLPLPISTSTPQVQTGLGISSEVTTGATGSTPPPHNSSLSSSPLPRLHLHSLHSSSGTRLGTEQGTGSHGGGSLTGVRGTSVAGTAAVLNGGLSRLFKRPSTPLNNHSHNNPLASLAVASEGTAAAPGPLAGKTGVPESREGAATGEGQAANPAYQASLPVNSNLVTACHAGHGRMRALEATSLGECCTQLACHGGVLQCY